jgi:hypothetical protein
MNLHPKFPKREVINIKGQQRIFLKTPILISSRIGLIKVRYCDIRRRVFLKMYYNLVLCCMIHLGFEFMQTVS